MLCALTQFENTAPFYARSADSNLEHRAFLCFVRLPSLRIQPLFMPCLQTMFWYSAFFTLSVYSVLETQTEPFYVLSAYSVLGTQSLFKPCLLNLFGNTAPYYALSAYSVLEHRAFYALSAYLFW